MIAGANKDDYHLRNVTPGEDFAGRVPRPPPGRRRRYLHRDAATRSRLNKTVEIGHIFKLGYKYSRVHGPATC